MTQAEAFLLEDLASAEQDVRESVTVSVDDNKFSALVSLAYNIGASSFRQSTLLSLLNQGDIQGAADQFGRWVYAGDQVLPGLVTRRQAERALFLTPVSDSPALRLFAPPDQSTVFWTLATQREHELVAWIAAQLGLRYHDQQAQTNKLFLGLPPEQLPMIRDLRDNPPPSPDLTLSSCAS